MTAVRLQIQQLTQELKVLTAKVKLAQDEFRENTSTARRKVCEGIWQHAVEDKEEHMEERRLLALKYANAGEGNSHLQWVIAQLNEELDALTVEMDEAESVYKTQEPDSDVQAVCCSIWQQLAKDKKDLLKARRALENLYTESGDKTISVTFIDPRRREIELVSFAGWPAFGSLTLEMEARFRDFQVEDYVFKAGDEVVTEANWAKFCSPSYDRLKLTVIRVSKPFSALKPEEGFTILGVPSSRILADTSPSQFLAADYDPEKALSARLQAATQLTTYGQLMRHTANDLVLRCLQRHPILSAKETMRRELISPLLFTAAALAGEIDVQAEYSVKGSRASGSIDYVLIYKDFTVVVVEAKLHEQLGDHIGQLCGELKSVREQFARLSLGKRKHEDIEELKELINDQKAALETFHRKKRGL